MSVIVENNNLVENEKRGRGRPKGMSNCSYYKWKITIFDKETNSFKEGKYISVGDINKDFSEYLGITLNSDYVKRIMTKYRADPDMKKKDNSFLARWGHIKIEKIHEKV
jgi:hypothetical protein